MPTNIRICTVTDAESLHLWEDSPHGTIFTHPYVIQHLAYKVEWWLCKKGDEPLCLWPAALDQNGNPYQPGFTYWVGPLWSKASRSSPSHRKLALETSVYESFLKAFETNYGGIEASLPLGIHDVRVFDWWNFHDADKPRFTIKPRYTAVLNISGSIESIIKGFRELRRRQLRKIWGTHDLALEHTCKPKEVIELYAQTMKRGNCHPEPTDYSDISSLIHLVDSGYGFVNTFRDQATGLPAAVVLVLAGKGTANIVLNLAHDAWRHRSVMPLAIYSAIIRAQGMGCNKIDFNGANSPLRGDDKHSYGAEEKLYFDISYKAQAA